MFTRNNMPKESLDFYMRLYSGHLKDTLNSDQNIYSWTSKQSYIVAGNMMTSAAFLCIDSCAIEEFYKKQVEEILGLDTKIYQLSMILLFGYRLIIGA